MDNVYDFKLPDGVTYKLTINQAKQLAYRWPHLYEEVKRRCQEIELDLKEKGKKKHKKDGFVPGWQANINEYITCPVQYRRALRDKGLVEIGYDYIPQETTTVSDPMSNPIMIKAIIDGGTYLSGNEITALENGELLKDVKVL